MVQQRIWTADRMQRRGIPNQYFCTLCERNLETPLHLFYECAYSRRVWELTADWVGAPQLKPTTWLPQHNISEWMLSLSQTGVVNYNAQSVKALKSIALLVLWMIWKERNNRIFNRAQASEENLMARIKEEARNWALAGAKCLTSPGDTSPSE